MSRSIAVTRTFSMGNCTTSRVSDSQDIQSARRHSLVGMKALMWANSNSRSLGWERVTSKDNILSNVVTPGSIPQFTIPRLAVEDRARCSSQERERSGEEEDADMIWASSDETECSAYMSTSLSSSLSSHSGSTSSGFCSSPAMRRKAHRSISDPESLKVNFVQQESSTEAQQLQQQHYDPSWCAALSLPHLPKVTTPYGFVTLSQSPQMASEEALLFQAGLGRRWSSRQEDECKIVLQRHPKAELRKTLSCQSQTSISTCGTSSSTSTSSSHTTRPTALVSGAGSERAASGMMAPKPGGPGGRSSGAKPKCRLWGVLRKHFVSQKGLQRQENRNKDNV